MDFAKWGYTYWVHDNIRYAFYDSGVVYLIRWDNDEDSYHYTNPDPEQFFISQWKEFYSWYENTKKLRTLPWFH